MNIPIATANGRAQGRSLLTRNRAGQVAQGRSSCGIEKKGKRADISYFPNETTETGSGRRRSRGPSRGGPRRVTAVSLCGEPVREPENNVFS